MGWDAEKKLSFRTYNPSFFIRGMTAWDARILKEGGGGGAKRMSRIG